MNATIGKHSKASMVRTALKMLPDALCSQIQQWVKQQYGVTVSDPYVYTIKNSETQAAIIPAGESPAVLKAARTYTVDEVHFAANLAHELVKVAGSLADAHKMLDAICK